MKLVSDIRLLLLCTLLALAACDEKQTPTPPGTTASQTAEQTAETVEELVNKLPDAPPPEKIEKPNVQFHGKFGTNGSMPTPEGGRLVEVDSKAVAELNLVANFRVESAFAERSVDPTQSIIVQFGGEEDDGLRVNVRYQGKTASRNIPPANNGPELVSNLDHTMDRLLDELGVPRKR